MKKLSKKPDQKLSIKVSTVRTLREGMTENQLKNVVGGLSCTHSGPSGTTSDNC